MTVLTRQQQEAITSIDRDVLVSAGAGSGKTHVLVERYIEILRHHNQLSVANLVAVTFTRKAANEMRTRLKARFQDLHDSCDSGTEKRWAQCLAEIDGARIGTIHSLCESILKAFPAEAAIDPQFEVLDDLAQAELLKTAIDQALRDVIGQKTPEHEILLEYQLEEIRAWLANVIRSWIQFDESIQVFAAMSDQDLRKHAEAVLFRAQQEQIVQLASAKEWRRVIDYLRATPWTDPTHVLEQYRLQTLGLDAAQERLLSLFAEADAFAVREIWQELLSLATMSVGNNGGRSEEAKSYRQVLKSVRMLAQDYSSKIPLELNEADSAAFAQMRALVALSRRAYALYEAEKKAALKLDYNDLITLAVKALSEPQSPARRHYTQSVAAILVDEFQDTNKMQSHLLSLLKGDETKLFLIGDDKQSIYKFQGADVSTFNEWKEKLAATSDNCLLKLSQSFRSHPDVVAFVNSLFGRLMEEARQKASFKASFEPLQAARARSDDDAERIELVLFDACDEMGKRKADESALLEARAVARWINDKVASGFQISGKGGGKKNIGFGDFAILVQRNKDFAHIEAALAESGIPYVMMAGRGFLERQEILDIENLLAFLSSPQDTHALIGCLRSPLFAITDDIIHQAAQVHGTSSLWQSLRALCQQHKPGLECLRRAVRLINLLALDANRIPLSELLRKIIVETGYDLVLLRLPNGHQRSRNLWKLVNLANECEHLSCADFVRSLKLMREFNVKQADAPLDSHGAVKLMTIHGSKGLEFPCVILPVLSVPATSRKDRLLYHRQYGMAFNTARLDEDEKPAWYEAASAIDAEMELAEKKRLFYVAVTRARDYLSLFMDRAGRDTPSFRLWLKEVLALDERDDVFESGTLSLANNASTLRLTTVDKEELMGDFAQSRSSSLHLNPEGDNASALSRVVSAEVKLDLIDPILPEIIEAPSVGAQTLRVTPKEGELFLDAAVVGTYFHALMENLPQTISRPSKELMHDLAVAQGDCVAHPLMLSRLIESGDELLAKFFASELCQLLKSARRRYVELPYLLCREDETRVRRPDLLFEDQVGQWHLVDYKTDHFQFENMEVQAKLHEKQLEAYIQDLKPLLKLTLKPSIYFAQFGILYAL